MLRVLVTYDISNNKSRRKISETCLDYGLDRAQYSVFSGLLKPVQVRALSKAIHPLLKDGHVMILQIPSDEWERRLEIGEMPHHDDD